jgi:hypothetical protein
MRDYVPLTSLVDLSTIIIAEITYYGDDEFIIFFISRYFLFSALSSERERERESSNLCIWYNYDHVYFTIVKPLYNFT